MTIAIDFDGTIVKHRYPRIGVELPFATETLRLLLRDGHRLILWSVREGDLLAEAVAWCRERGVEFYAINRNYPEEGHNDAGYSRKLKADLFIDDRNLGAIPDWGTIYQMIRCEAPHTLPHSERSVPHRSRRRLTLRERISGWIEE